MKIERRKREETQAIKVEERTEIKREKSQEREERERERGGTGNFPEKESTKRGYDSQDEDDERRKR